LNPPVFNCDQTFMYINKTTPILNSIFRKVPIILSSYKISCSFRPLSEFLLFFPEIGLNWNTY